MNVLALDLATKTGWALQEAGRIESGVETFEPKRDESRGMRFVDFNRWLDHFTTMAEGASPRVDIIVYEQAHHRGGAATEIAAGFVTRVHEFCAVRGIEYSSVHTATLKKWTTGRGNAKKPDMLEAVARRWGRRVDDDNEADAVALLFYALAEIVPAAALTHMNQPISREDADRISQNGQEHRHIRAVDRPGAIVRRYLGDGVYATFDGLGVWLTAEDGVRASDAIYLAMNVYSELARFIADATPTRRAGR